MFCLSETDENKTQSLYITLKHVTENQTSVTLDLYFAKKRFANLYALLIKKQTVKNLQQSLMNLDKLAVQ